MDITTSIITITITITMTISMNGSTLQVLFDVLRASSVQVVVTKMDWIIISAQIVERKSAEGLSVRIAETNFREYYAYDCSGLCKNLRREATLTAFLFSHVEPSF